MSSAQSLRTKRAEVEFHNATSLGEPGAALADYAEKNRRRGAFLRQNAERLGPLTPFLEIGANAGHSSYMLVNEFGADGFALDISADALRHGARLMEMWNLARAPVRLGGDAARLPFRDNSLRTVISYQTLGQFRGIESVFREARRVLAPGGVFLFAEEPLQRLLTMRLFSSPHLRDMRPWQKRLYHAGLLGYLVEDIIGSREEKLQGIHLSDGLSTEEWRRLSGRCFEHVELLFEAPGRGWGESWLKHAALAGARGRPDVAAEWLGGTVTGICRKAGPAQPSQFRAERFDEVLQCPDCAKPLRRIANQDLFCGACSYRARCEEGVYNLLPSVEREKLYPSSGEDVIYFSRAGHESQLLDGWYEIEGVHGNRYRWIGHQATARLRPRQPGQRRLRVRGYASPDSFREGVDALTISFQANGAGAGSLRLHEPGLFVYEADLPEAAEYLVSIEARPVFVAPGADSRPRGVTFSLIRLVEGEE